MVLKFDENGMALTRTRILMKKREELEKRIRADFRAIISWLNINPVPKLVIKHNRKNSYYDRSTHTIVLGVEEGYKRTMLVHECLHAKGLRHGPGFRSHLSKDTLSPAIERRIFGEGKING